MLDYRRSEHVFPALGVSEGPSTVLNFQNIIYQDVLNTFFK